MIAIVDYGAGNLMSVKKAFDWIGQECAITSRPEEILSAAKVVLPGVGNFATTATLRKLGLQRAVAAAIERGIPFLGICVGMQWMFEGSQEASETPGLGLFDGVCERFPASVKSPHVGWNQLEIAGEPRLLRGIAASSFVYFTHSFRVPVNGSTTACSEYGGRFAVALERANVFGVQFHPEKSGEVGLKMLRNFCAL